MWAARARTSHPGHMAPRLATSVRSLWPAVRLQATHPARRCGQRRPRERPLLGGDGGGGGWASSRRESLTLDTVATCTRHETGRVVPPEPGARCGRWCLRCLQHLRPNQMCVRCSRRGSRLFHLTDGKSSKHHRWPRAPRSRHCSLDLPLALNVTRHTRAGGKGAHTGYLETRALFRASERPPRACLLQGCPRRPAAGASRSHVKRWVDRPGLSGPIGRPISVMSGEEALSLTVNLPQKHSLALGGEQGGPGRGRAGPQEGSAGHPSTCQPGLLPAWAREELTDGTF